MAKVVDKISSLIDPKYFNWIREAILKHGKINVRALSRELGILDGNTYFRNFIEDNKQDYLGMSGLTSVLDKCGYELKVVPVKRNDIDTLTTISKISNESFLDIRETISKLSESVKWAPKPEKVKVAKVIKNSSVINDGIMGIEKDDDLILAGMFDDEDININEDDLNIGGETSYSTFNLKVDLSTL